MTNKQPQYNKSFDKEQYIALETNRLNQGDKELDPTVKIAHAERIKFYGDIIEDKWDVLNLIMEYNQALVSYIQKRDFNASETGYAFPGGLEGITESLKLAISGMDACAKDTCRPLMNNRLIGKEQNHMGGDIGMWQKREYLAILGWADFIDSTEHSIIDHWTPTKKGQEIYFADQKMGKVVNPEEYLVRPANQFLDHAIRTDIHPDENEHPIMLERLKAFSTVFAPSEGGKYFIETLKKESEEHPEIYEREWSKLIRLYDLGLKDLGTLRQKYGDKQKLVKSLYENPSKNPDPARLFSLLKQKTKEK